LIFDTSGNLYGTTSDGGVFGSWNCGIDGVPCGTAFKLAPLGSGKWKETVLYGFGSNGFDVEGGLVFDGNGNLFGTTAEGGSGYEGCYAGGCGTVFELTGSGNKWKEKVLYNFPNGFGDDGCYPEAGMIIDAAGTLYGTAAGGCVYNPGVVFQMRPGVKGRWKEKVLYIFCSAQQCTDGDGPLGGLVMDTAGNLLGTTSQGGDPSCNAGYGCGTVFELMPGAAGKWTEKVLHSFNGTDGTAPAASLVFDANGNLYGTTSGGGAHGYGTVFKITPQ
jgi:uncharacterized repeat protein (TIGR03803 family)